MTHEHQLAEALPDHWDTPEGRMVAEQYAAMERTDLAMSDTSDFALANAQYLVSRDSFDLIHYQTAAKERIRWLSAQLAVTRQALASYDSNALDPATVEWCAKIADAHIPDRNGSISDVSARATARAIAAAIRAGAEQ